MHRGLPPVRDTPPELAAIRSEACHVGVVGGEELLGRFDRQLLGKSTYSQTDSK